MSPIVTPILAIIGKVFDHVWPDPAQKAEAQLKLLQLEKSGELAALDADLKLALAQIAVNEEEAKSDSIFKSGWRPAIGWICGSAFAWEFVLRPALVFGLAAAGKPVTLPTADMSELMPVLLGMLGLGGFRTFEKVKGKA